MNRSILLFLLLALLAASCAPATPSIGAAASPTAKLGPTTAPTAQIAVSASATPAPSPTLPAATATTPAPSATLPPSPTVLSQYGTPFNPDCGSFPGFPTCGQSLPLSGRLALLDAGKGTARIYDFGTRIAIELKISPGAQRIEWLDQGNLLAAYDGSGKASQAWVNPILSRLPQLPPLSPEGTSVFTAADGSTAWLDAKFAFHVKLPGSTKEQVYPAEAQPSDKIHQLLGWVPGTKLLLAGYHFSSNSMWINGNRLYTLDASSGTIKELAANLRLSGIFRWYPNQAGLMLYGDSSQSPLMGAPRLAALDVTGAKGPAFLIADAQVSSSYLAWMPDGKAVLHAAQKVGEAAKAGDPFALAAIYLTGYPVGTTRRLTQPAGGERDDWPQLLADGKHFLYTRTGADGKTLTLRLGSLDGSLDGLVASGLASPQLVGPVSPNWGSVMAFAP